METPNSVRFNLLKHVSVLERFITFLLFFIIYIAGLYLLVRLASFSENYKDIYIRIFAVFLGMFLLFLERRRDKIVRRRIIGEAILNTESLVIKEHNRDSVKYSISEIPMLWINYGLNTVSNKKHEFRFRDFETLNLRLVGENDNVITYHINNHAIAPENYIVSDYIEYLRRKHYFFHIHFHMKKSFDKKEYQKIIKKHSIQKSSLQRRRNRNR